MQSVIIHTDGACKGNPGPGGYGSVLVSGRHRKELAAGYRLTTNNRMEPQAADTRRLNFFAPLPMRFPRAI